MSANQNTKITITMSELIQEIIIPSDFYLTTRQREQLLENINKLLDKKYNTQPQPDDISNLSVRQLVALKIKNAGYWCSEAEVYCEECPLADTKACTDNKRSFKKNIDRIINGE